VTDVSPIKNVYKQRVLIIFSMFAPKITQFFFLVLILVWVSVAIFGFFLFFKHSVFGKKTTKEDFCLVS